MKTNSWTTTGQAKDKSSSLGPDATLNTDIHKNSVFYIYGVWCWLLLSQLSKEKTNYMIKQLMNIEVLDMTLISTSEYQYWPRLTPRSILVFSGGYHIISNTSTVNNCILLLWLRGKYSMYLYLVKQCNICDGQYKSRKRTFVAYADSNDLDQPRRFSSQMRAFFARFQTHVILVWFFAVRIFA